MFFFAPPSLTFFQIHQKFFIFVALINFSRKLSNVFFISSPSLTLPKIGSMFFFLKCFFLPPSLIRFRVFSDQNREIKQSGLKHSYRHNHSLRLGQRLRIWSSNKPTLVQCFCCYDCIPSISRASLHG